MKSSKEKDKNLTTKENEFQKKSNKSEQFVAEVVDEEIVVQQKKKVLSRTNVSQLFTHSLNELISIFVTTFLISYIYSVSTNYMLNVGLFYVFVYLSMAIFYLIISKFIVKTNRVIFYRIALIVKAAFIVLIIFVGQDLANLVMLAGALYGFSEACYWCSFNIMKNELVRKSSMKLYASLQQIFARVITVVAPIVLGTIIDADSFLTSAIVVAVVVLIQFVASFLIKSNRPEGSEFNLKEFFVDVKNLGEKKSVITQMFGLSFCYGLCDAVAPLNTILIMLVYNSNASLGYISAVAAVASILVLVFLGKFTRPGKNLFTYTLFGLFQLIVAIMIVFDINKTFIIIYTIVYGGFQFTHKYSFDVCRNVILKKLNMYDSIDEYQAMIETLLLCARIVMYGLVALFGWMSYTYFGTEGLILSAKVLSVVAMSFIFVINVLIGFYEKKLVKYNIL